MAPASLLFPLAVLLLAWGLLRAAGGRGALGGAFHAMRGNERWVLLLLAVTGAELAFNRTLSGRGGFAEVTLHPLSSFLASLQAAVPAEASVPLFSALYLLVFPALLIFMPLYLLGKDGGLFKRYCLGLSLAYLSLMVLHFALLSPRPGLDPGSGIIPLMYSDPFWGQISGDLGSRGQSLPSGHTTVLAAMTTAVWKKDRIMYPLLATLVLTAVGVLYLGLHWPLDVAAGLLIGPAAMLSAARLLKKKDDQEV